MKYNELKKTMKEYQLGNLSRLELKAAISLWQLKTCGGIAEWKPGDKTIRMGL